MKKLFIIPLIAITLTSCSTNVNPIESKVFCFDTMVETKLYDGTEDNLKDIENILRDMDALTDNYHEREVSNVYTINQTNEDVVVDERLYRLLDILLISPTFGFGKFNPFCGSLAKKWKEALANGQILSSEVINYERNKMNSTHLKCKGNNTVQREGEGEIDLGGMAKGYTLDLVKQYLEEQNLSQYLINAGSSSILLGEKNTDDGFFTIGLKDLNNAYLKLKNCFISTSSISEQGVKIGDITYSHIINPETGRAINENDAVVIISDNSDKDSFGGGTVGDVYSTALMNNTLDEIKNQELHFEYFNIKVLVIKNGEIIYRSEGIDIYYH